MSGWGSRVEGQSVKAGLAATHLAAYVAVTALVVLNALLLEPVLRDLASRFPETFDFTVLHEAVRMPNPYDHPNGFLWSPLTIPVLYALTAFGPLVWALLHFACLVPLGWRVGGLAALSYPFWFDISTGNVMTLVAVVGYLALSGSRRAMVGFLVLALLMPRPLMGPLVVWLLWREPWTRRWFVGLFVGHAALVLGSGYAFDWVGRLTTMDEILVLDSVVNLSPSRWLGWLWWPIGLVIAGVALRFGRVGLASLAIQPYLYPQYLLMGLFELRKVPVPHGDAVLAGGVLPPVLVDEHVAEEHLLPRRGG